MALKTAVQPNSNLHSRTHMKTLFIYTSLLLSFVSTGLAASKRTKGDVVPVYQGQVPTNTTVTTTNQTVTITNYVVVNAVMTPQVVSAPSVRPWAYNDPYGDGRVVVEHQAVQPVVVVVPQSRSYGSLYGYRSYPSYRDYDPYARTINHSFGTTVRFGAFFGGGCSKHHRHTSHCR